MTLSENDLIDFGKIVGIHGVQGDLKVNPFTPGSDVLIHAQVVYINSRAGVNEGYSPKRISIHKGNLLLRLEGIESVSQAEGIVGSTVRMLRADLPVLPNGEYYLHEIRGFEVQDRTCGEIGFLEDMFTTAAHDIYEVQGPYGEVLIPVVDAFILDVDLKKKRIQVDLPEGLIPESDEN